MKKRLLLIILFIAVLLGTGKAQFFYQIGPEDYQAIDESQYVVTYETTYVENPNEPTRKSKDRIVLEIGKNLSRCYNMKMYVNDSTTAAWVARGRDGGPTLESGPFNADIYKNAKNREVTVVQRTPIRGPILNYSDFMIKATDWVMKDGTKQILGYLCKKASCTYRGRTWTAWYALDIPISDGPWKLCGLPGLILQADDNKGHFSFACIGIEKGKHPIKMLDNIYYQESSRSDAIRIIRLYYADLFGYLAMLSPGTSIQAMTSKGKKVNLDDTDKYTTPYNPIELK